MVIENANNTGTCVKTVRRWSHATKKKRPVSGQSPCTIGFGMLHGLLYTCVQNSHISIDKIHTALIEKIESSHPRA